MLKAVKKAVIPAAGLGTRFLPATKSIPKEMFPIVDKPILLHIVEEAVNAGIEDVVLVIGPGKSAIKDFFAVSTELEDLLAKTGKHEILNSLRRIQSLTNIIYANQDQALGLGHAVACARTAVGKEPFALLLGDELMFDDDGKPSGIGFLCERAITTGMSTVAIMEVAPSEVSKYGIVEVKEGFVPRGSLLMSSETFTIQSVVEKPSIESAPSNFALPGRYVFTARIFSELADLKPGKNGEIQLTDAMTLVAQSDGMKACKIPTHRCDAGDKFGFVQANIELGLKHPEVKDRLRKYLKEFVGKL